MSVRVQARLRFEQGRERDAGDEEGFHPLHEASFRGHTSSVLKLLTAGATIDAVCSDGRTPLAAACQFGRDRTAKALLEHSTSPDLTITDARGRTPLGWACHGGHVACCRLLLKAGASASVVDASDETPLVTACQMGHAECARALLDHGVSSKDVALVTACRGGHLKAASVCLMAGAQPTDACFEVAAGNTELAALLNASQSTEDD